MNQVWKRLRELFGPDDGSLPEIEIGNLDHKEVQKVFAMLWRRGVDATAGGASYCDCKDEKDYPISCPEEAATLVCSKRAESIHVVLGGIECAGSRIPDLGVFVYPDGIILDYKMGSAWGPRQVEALLVLICEIAKIAPNMTVRHELWDDVFFPVWDQFRAARSTT
jgi:hypothetical protein